MAKQTEKGTVDFTLVDVNNKGTTEPFFHDHEIAILYFHHVESLRQTVAVVKPTRP
jgi:hypothetical protein